MVPLIALLMLTEVSPSSIPATPLVTGEGEPVTCKLVWEVHSRVPTRICRTNAKWAEIERETEDELRSSRHQRSSGCQGLMIC